MCTPNTQHSNRSAWFGHESGFVLINLAKTLKIIVFEKIKYLPWKRILCPSCNTFFENRFEYRLNFNTRRQSRWQQLEFMQCFQVTNPDDNLERKQLPSRWQHSMNPTWQWHYQTATIHGWHHQTIIWKAPIVCDITIWDGINIWSTNKTLLYTIWCSVVIWEAKAYVLVNYQ
jgi:hypothetical protein